jgi:hypothetical protein
LTLKLVANGNQVDEAYELLEAFHHGTVDGRVNLTAMITESEALSESQDLFELYVSDYVHLTRCKVRLFSNLHSLRNGLQWRVSFVTGKNALKALV